LALTQRKLEEYYDDVRAYERLLKKKERLFKRLEKQMHENIKTCEQIVEWYKKTVAMTDHLSVQNYQSQNQPALLLIN